MERHRTKRNASWCLQVGMCLVAGVVVLQAAFGPRFDVSPPAHIAQAPKVAVDGAGNALIVWQAAAAGTDTVFGRVVMPDGTMGPVRTVGVGVEPHVVVAPGGEGLVIWRRPEGGVNRLSTRPLSTASVLGKRLSVSPLGQEVMANSHRAATDDFGNASMVWVTDVSGLPRVMGAGRRVDATVTPTAKAVSGISSNTQALQPSVASQANGNAIVASYRLLFTDTPGWRVRFGLHRPTLTNSGGRYHVGYTVGDDSSAPIVAIDDQPNVYHAFRDAIGEVTLVKIQSPPSGPRIQLTSPSGMQADQHALAVSRDGHAIIAWRLVDRIQVRTLSPANVATEPEDITEIDPSVGMPAVAIRNGGRAIVTWARTINGVTRIQARTRAGVTGTWQPVKNVSPAGVSATESWLWMNQPGAAWTAWSLTSGLVQAAFSPAP